MNQLYAITDIETAGGRASDEGPGCGITEIAVILHDGQREIDRWESLINPEVPIPTFITGLTGINDEMVASAPRFEDIAKELHQWLAEAVFVAHNVHFDLGFIKAAFAKCGIAWDPPRLCTVRLGRKFLPEVGRYNLSALCAWLDIDNDARHRAMGDTAATAELFWHLYKSNRAAIEMEVSKSRGTDWWPEGLPHGALDGLRDVPGVYRFYGEDGGLLYIGMSITLHKRVRQHFSGKARNGELAQRVVQVKWEETGTALMAGVLEDVLIRKHKPPMNVAQKTKGKPWGVQIYEDRSGLKRLALVKGAGAGALSSDFSGRGAGEKWLRDQVLKRGLHPGWSSLPGTAWSEGWIDNAASRNLHNARVDAWAQEAKPLQADPEMLVELQGAEPGSVSALRIENGTLTGLRSTADAPWLECSGSTKIERLLASHGVAASGHAVN